MGPWPDFDPRPSESPTSLAEGHIQQRKYNGFIYVYVLYAHIDNTQLSNLTHHIHTPTWMCFVHVCV